jgi:hypothetical protein
MPQSNSCFCHRGGRTFDQNMDLLYGKERAVITGTRIEFQEERRADMTAVCIFSKEENQSHGSFANVLREERRGRA